ncbi:cytochrome c oxidase subunit 5A, mitochondrial [Arapaima gigas]
MLRATLSRSISGIRRVARVQPSCTAPVALRPYSHAVQETDEEFDARWVTYFNKPDIDAWELRKGVNTLVGYDLVPEPKILDAALRACRRLDDFASAVRILEVTKDKAGIDIHTLVGFLMDCCQRHLFPQLEVSASS